MEYPNDAKILAVATGLKALIAALHTQNTFNSELFIAHLQRGRQELEKSGQNAAAEALFDFFDHIVRALNTPSPEGDKEAPRKH